MSNSVRPHRHQPTRLPSPWDSPGKNTGVGCPVQFNHSAYNWEQIKVHLQNIHDNASLNAQLLQKKIFKTFSKNLPSSHNLETFSLVQFSSVAQSCPTLCYPMNHSTPGLPVHHQLPEFTQTHIHRVGDAIQPSHPLSSPSPPAPNPSQHQSLFQ